MIVTLIMDLLKSFFLFVISLFPRLPDMSWLNQTLDPVVKLIASIDLFVDIRIAGLCIVLLFVFANIEFVWGIIMWVIRKIPGVS